MKSQWQVNVGQIRDTHTHVTARFKFTKTLV
ncbi:MAG: hypothetical protein JWM36_536 [Hyphomicrobiales bacterium]|nr:hypothetical protein [Hyphomicrobiales bacterium]